MRRASGSARIATAVIAVLLAVGALAGASARAEASAKSASALAGAASTSYAKPGWLLGVAGVSRTNAWAVGYSGTGAAGTTSKTLLLHWNGSRWAPVTTPKPVPGELTAIAAVSPTSVWAVGSAASQAVIVLHWNGTAWHRVPVPALPGTLVSVAAAGSQVWVTDSNDRGFLHLTGGHWYVVPIAATILTRINGIAMVAGKTLWAAGWNATTASDCLKTKIWGWIDSLWQPVPIPTQQGCGTLDAIAAGPHGTAFVVGEYATCLHCTEKYASLQWTGKEWRRVPVLPDVKNGSDFAAVSSAPDGAAWAVASFNPVIILRWTGKAWRQVPDGKFPSYTQLAGVAAISPSDAWAVGEYAGPGDESMTWILHWNGKTWS